MAKRSTLAKRGACPLNMKERGRELANLAKDTTGLTIDFIEFDGKFWHFQMTHWEMRRLLDSDGVVIRNGGLSCKWQPNSQEVYSVIRVDSENVENLVYMMKNGLTM